MKSCSGEATLLGLTGGGKLGEIFSRHTTNPMRRDRAVVFDVSSIDQTETDVQAAVLLACTTKVRNPALGTRGRFGCLAQPTDDLH